MEKAVLEEIVRACLEDRRLLEIVKGISAMSEEEREIFKRKMLRYFADKTSDEDVQAYRFFKTVLDGNNASLVIEEVRRREGDKG